MYETEEARKEGFHDWQIRPRRRARKYWVQHFLRAIERALANASDELLQTMLRRGLGETLETAARVFAQLLEAEDCALFLADEEKPGGLVLMSAHGDQAGSSASPRRLRLHDPEGLVMHLARLIPTTTLHGPPLHELLPPGLSPSYLASRKTFSVLKVELTARRGYVLGMIKANNKKGPTAGPAPPPLLPWKTLQ